MMSLRDFLFCRRGAAATELALLLPFLVLLMFGGIELGYYFYLEHQVVKGVRDGARYASRQSFSLVSCTKAIDPAVELAIKEVTRTGRVSGGTARVPGWTNAKITIPPPTCGPSDYTKGIYAGESSAHLLTISTTVPYTPLFGGVGIINSTYNLNASQKVAVMGI